MEALLGKTLEGKYTIVSQLERGGMATVFLAEQPSMKRKVAIKVLPKEFSYDKTFVARFRQEAEAIASLIHPHILPVYDYGEEDGWTYIVMTYLEGGSLADLIKREGNAIPLALITRVIRQIADALDYGHKQGIIHRDLKPGNILLDKQQNAYLTDFGIAKLTTSTSQLTGSGIIGTPAYIAPEMASEGGLTHKVDIYALGVTLFHALTGRQPFDADTPTGILMAHMTKPVPSIQAYRQGLPDGLQDVINIAMAKAPGDRYQTSGELALAMERVVSRESARSVEDPSTLEIGFDEVDADTKRKAQTALDEAASDRGARKKILFKPLWIVVGSVALLAVIAMLVLWIVLPSAQPQTAGDIGTEAISPSQTSDSPLATQESSNSVMTIDAARAERDALIASAEDWSIVLNEDFVDNDVNWFTNEAYDDGDFCRARIVLENEQYTYYLEALSAEGVVWSEPYPRLVVPERFTVSLDVQQLEVVGTAYYGMVFRYNDSQNYYLFQICDAGCVIVSVVEQGYFTTLYSQTSEAVRPGEINTLKALGDNEHYLLFVNGEFITEVTNNTLKDGGVGVSGEIAHGVGSSRFVFDNLIVRVPDN